MIYISPQEPNKVHGSYSFAASMAAGGAAPPVVGLHMTRGQLKLFFFTNS